MSRLDSNGKAALKKSQRQWIKYRNDQFEFIALYYGSLQGTIYVPMRAGDRVDEVKQRASNLRSYLNLLDMK
jgi:uncharacterized protein YecT (DUF1311 family)